jgi:hypothetical protein
MIRRIAYAAAAVVMFAVGVHAVTLQLIDAIQGINYGDNLGRACEGLGDINGDGYPDFLISEWGPDLLYLYLSGPNLKIKGPKRRFFL